jgi:hypothetical protein
VEARSPVSELSQIYDDDSTRVETSPDAVQCEAVINMQFLSAGQQSALLLKLAYRHPQLVLTLILEDELLLPAGDVTAANSPPKVADPTALT